MHRTRHAEEDAGFLGASQIMSLSDFDDEDDHRDGSENLAGAVPSRGEKGMRSSDTIGAVKLILRLADGALLSCYLLALILNVVVLLLSAKGGKTSAFSWVLSVKSVDFTRREM